MQIPIIGDRGEILGWTENSPKYQGLTLRHEEAERLLRGPISCTYVQIDNRADAQRAGAPPGWAGAWRCMAICRGAVGPAAPKPNSAARRHPQPR